jgi:iron complex transport system substrate-binding protein
MFSQGSHEASGRRVTDSYDRVVTVDQKVNRVICSGPGALRMLVYLDAADLAVAADTIESRDQTVDPRPYALANPQLADLPVFGEFRGRDDPERILSLEHQPQVIFKTYPESGYDANMLQERTGIPVVTLDYGDLVRDPEAFYRSLRIMAEVIGRSERAESVIAFIESVRSDLQNRISETRTDDRSVYIGGIAYKGAQGITATDPVYPPLNLLGLRQCAFDPDAAIENQTHMIVSAEQLLAWDPENIFIDASTLTNPDEMNALRQLYDLKIYEHLQARASNEIYLLLPYNWYTVNIGSALADAYALGSVLFPEEFSDIDPAEKADEMYRFLVGRGVFSQLQQMFDNRLFMRVSGSRP